MSVPDFHPHPKSHIPALDGFRGLAVILVMFSHFIAPSNLLDSASIWHNLLLSGFVGVNMFFVLSGFLISGILIDAPKQAPRYFITFYARRALRIFPLYYAILIPALLFFRNPYGDSPWWFILFASNLGDSYHGAWLNVTHTVSLAHLWSLAIEEQFYLIWPFLVFALPTRALVFTCLALLIAAPISGLLFHLAGNPIAYYLFTLHHLNSLAIGALVAIAYRNPTIWKSCLAHSPTLLALLTPLMLAGLMAGSPPLSSIQQSLAPIFWAAILIQALHAHTSTAHILSHPSLTSIGKISFGLYLFHSLLLPLAYQSFYHPILLPACPNPTIALAIFVPLAFLASFAIAALSWVLFEKPILSLNRHFSYTPRPPHTPHTPPSP